VDRAARRKEFALATKGFAGNVLLISLAVVIAGERKPECD
jgi:hypothetical protein